MGRLLVVGLVATSLLAACGGSSARLSKQEFAMRADALCTKYASDLKKLGQPQSFPELAKFTDKAVPLAQRLIDDTKKLKPPKNEQAIVDQWNEQNEKVVDAIRALGNAARKDDRVAARKALQSGNTANARSNALGTQLGMTACTRD